MIPCERRFSENLIRPLRRTDEMLEVHHAPLTPVELIERQRIETEHRPVDAKDVPARTHV